MGSNPPTPTMDTYDLKKSIEKEKPDHFYRNMRILVVLLSIAAVVVIEIIAWSFGATSWAAPVAFVPLWILLISGAFGNDEDDDDGDI